MNCAQIRTNTNKEMTTKWCARSKYNVELIVGFKTLECLEVNSNTTDGESRFVTSDSEQQEHPTTATTVSLVAVANQSLK